MNTISENAFCTGCGACNNICSVDAITMKFNTEGFLHPFVDSDKCINCGSCTKICPILNLQNNNNSLLGTYAALANDEIRFASSSGGAFSVFAKKILQENGVVFGAVWTDEFLVRHSYIENENDLEKLRRSKYLQSDIGFSFRQVKQFLEEDRKVLFVGTPCQIAGLRRFLGLLSETEKLITVDFLCFCTPSAELFHRYLEEEFGIDSVKSVEFRHKEHGWKCNSFKIELKDGTILKDNPDWQNTDTFQILYHDAVALRNEICENCRFTDFPRQGDITIGDFWGIEQHDISWNDGKGTSLIMVNNDKANLFLESCKKEFNRIERVPDDWARNKGNRIANDGRKLSGQYNHLFELKKNHSLRTCADYITNNKHDIGLICLLNWNYGNQLTNYSLYRTLSEMGYSTLVIDMPNDCHMAQEFIKNNTHNKFALFEKNPYPEYDLLVNQNDKNAIIKQNDLCKLFVVGSDQIFRAAFARDMNFHPVADWIRSYKYIFSYGSSFATANFEDEGFLKEKIKFFLKRFNKISVREKSGVELLKKEFDITAKHVLDPVFLTSKMQYSQMAKIGENIIPTKPFIACYVLDINEDRADIIKYCAEQIKSNTIFAAADSFQTDPIPWSLETHIKIKTEEWLAMIKNCDFFVTDSFHGMCFAIIFNKPFIVVFNKWQWRGEERIKSLAELFNLQDRVVSSIDEIKTKDLVATSIEWDSVNTILTTYKDECMKWLEECVQEGINYHGNLTGYDFAFENSLELKKEMEKLQIMNKEIEMNMLKELQENKNAFTDFETKYNNLESNMMNYIQARDATILQQSNRLNELNQELQCLKNSKSFRIGRIITWLPRKIRDYLKR